MFPKLTHTLASKFKLLTNTSLHSIDLLKRLMVFFSLVLSAQLCTEGWLHTDD